MSNVTINLTQHQMNDIAAEAALASRFENAELKAGRAPSDARTIGRERARMTLAALSSTTPKPARVAATFDPKAVEIELRRLTDSGMDRGTATRMIQRKLEETARASTAPEAASARLSARDEAVGAGTIVELADRIQRENGCDREAAFSLAEKRMRGVG